ncbi:TonB-dependent Receptor Plug Domain [Sphingobium faniae]|nr:TonB-dependent Receptor Plug Domain [Sphingobium faniae]
MSGPILFIHRWLGVLVGLIMTIWCLSGFVMMYVDYPRLLPAEQLSGLEPLVLPAPGVLERIDIPADTALSAARIEMLDGRPVLRLRPALDPSRPIEQTRALPQAYDLQTGKPLTPVSASQALSIGERFARGFGIAGKATSAVPTGMDQWTVQTFRGHQPLYRVEFDDPAGSTVYVAGNSGKIVQQTTRFERFWGWLGAVPHWLYPTMLRQDGALWSQVIVWSSLLGCFLTATGLWVGIGRLRRRRDGSLGSPYRGLWWWHHIFGLFFGILTLTWVASGLFSMNPWGFLGSMAGFAEAQRLEGKSTWGHVRNAMSAVGDLPEGTARLQSAPLGGQSFVVAVNRDGDAARFGADGRRAPLDRAALAAALRDGPPIASLALLRSEDSYYYTHKFPMSLPVWRAILADEEQTRLYMDPQTGSLIRAFDRDGRNFRWLQNGLHSLDLPFMRRRPVWDLIVLPLLAAVTLVCATGTWMGFRKASRDVGSARRRWRRKIRPDGIEAADPYVGEYDFGTLIANPEARIEVLRGLQSSLYGSDAIGGVIHYITLIGAEAPGLSVRAEGGSLGTYSGSARAAGVAGALDYAVSASYYHTDGRPISEFGTRDVGSDSLGLNAKLIWSPTESFKLTGVARYSHTDADLGDFGLDPVDSPPAPDPTPGDDVLLLALDAPGTYYKNKAFYGFVRAEFAALDGRWTNALSGQIADTRRRGFTPAGLDYGNNGRRLKGSFESSLRFGSETVIHRLTAAVDMEREEFQNKTPGTGSPYDAFDRKRHTDNIGIVGLMAPHVVRPLVAHRPGRVLGPAMLAGAILVTLADIATRALVFGGAPLNVGVFTSLIGTPFFLWLVLHIRRRSP